MDFTKKQHNRQSRKPSAPAIKMSLKKHKHMANYRCQTQRSDMQITAETACRSMTSDKIAMAQSNGSTLLITQHKCPSEIQRKVEKPKIKREGPINHEGVV